MVLPHLCGASLVNACFPERDTHPTLCESVCAHTSMGRPVSQFRPTSIDYTVVSITSHSVVNCRVH